MRQLLNVYFISGSSNVSTNLPDVLTKAIAGGITLFQYREKGSDALTGNEKLALGRELQSICKKTNIPFIVNDDVELALALDADGVHVGQDDGEVRIVREKIGDKMLGVSAHSYEEAQQALNDGADYLGIGPVFPTSTKNDTEAVCGPGFISTLREKGIDAPIVAIGGINIDNAHKVAANKADGISVISAISKANNPALAAKRLATVFN